MLMNSDIENIDSENKVWMDNERGNLQTILDYKINGACAYGTCAHCDDLTIVHEKITCCGEILYFDVDVIGEGCVQAKRF